MSALIYSLVCSASLIGHGCLWIAAINRGNAVGWRRPAIKALSGLLHGFLLGIPLLALGALMIGSPTWLVACVWSYVLATAAIGLSFTPVEFIRRLQGDAPYSSAIVASRVIDVASCCEQRIAQGWKASILSHVPGNRLGDLECNAKEIELRRLPASLDGLRLGHLSDFHFSDRITYEYYQRALAVVAEQPVDAWLITGDLFDKESCLTWIQGLFGNLNARYGVFFILGNHDQRLSNVPDLRRRLEDVGWCDLGGKSHTLYIDGKEVLLTGHEGPWFPAPEEPTSEEEATRRLRILLSHSPDQWRWGARHGYDLVLAGHNHGGQIRFPVLGPIFSPSRYGVRYAGGVYREGDLVMHVSRGIGSYFPARMNCPHEATSLVLRSAHVARESMNEVQAGADETLKVAVASEC